MNLTETHAGTEDNSFPQPFNNFENLITITRRWAMPNSRTFKIKPIRELILKYAKGTVIDPFANESSIKKHLNCERYINNDLDPDYDCDYHLDALEFLQLFADKSVDTILYDPPFSPRQVVECYKKLEKTVSIADMNCKFYSRLRSEIMRILKPNGVIISCGWHSNGIGKKYGFNLTEVLIVAHGGRHNDTLVSVEIYKGNTEEDKSILAKLKTLNQ
jgi:hypothetical protein